MHSSSYKHSRRGHRDPSCIVVPAMKVGDKVEHVNKPEYGIGKIVRFYANQSTVLVEFPDDKGLSYCDYHSLVKKKSR